MSIEVLLIDLDGVVFHKAAYFSERAKILYLDADHAAIHHFFTQGAYKEIECGNADLQETLARNVKQWNVSVSGEQLLSDWFDPESEIDTVVINQVQRVRQNGVRCVIATNHSLYRKEDVWNNRGIQKYFDDIITSSDLGAKKSEKEFFERFLEKYGIDDPQTVMFVDNDERNVACAKACGLNTRLFVDMEDMKMLLR